MGICSLVDACWTNTLRPTRLRVRGSAPVPNQRPAQTTSRLTVHTLRPIRRPIATSSSLSFPNVEITMRSSCEGCRNI